MFKKPKKNIQRRVFSDFGDERDQSATRGEDGQEKETECPKVKPKEAKPEKAPRQPKTTLLSFGDEEGKKT